QCGFKLDELEPRMFSFNSPHGACPACGGLGTLPEFDVDLVVPDAAAPVQSAIEPWRQRGRAAGSGYARLMEEFCARFGVAPATPFQALPERIRLILLHGTTPRDEAEFGQRFEGVLPNLRRRLETTEQE